MESLGLQFKGTHDVSLLALLLGVILVILLAAGTWHALRRRWYPAALAYAGALGPIALAGLLVGVGVARQAKGDKKALSAFTGAGATLAATVAALVLFVATGSIGLMAWLLAVALYVAIAVGVFYAAVFAYLGTARMAILMALRSGAIIALMLVLFKPALSYSLGGDQRKPFLPVLVDRSGSMSVSDDAKLPPRYTQAVQQLRYQRERIERRFRPMYYHFATGLGMALQVDDLAQLAPAGEGTDTTNIAGALDQVVHDLDSGQAPGVLLITDGRHNDTADIARSLQNIGRPVYVAGIGSTNIARSGRRNLAIVEVKAPMEAIRNNTTTIRVVVRGSSVPDVEQEVKLIDEASGQTLATAHRSLDKDTGQGEFELKYTPTDAPGSGPATGPAGGSGPTADVRKLRLVVTPLANEVTDEDNAFALHMLVTNPRLRVLYVQGLIGAGEYKWLKRTLDTDPNVQFMGLCRTSGNTFMVQGNIGGVKLQGLPATEADFKLFDVIILGDLDRTFWTATQLDLLAAWVSRGGGLLMIGGSNSFGPGGYGGTRLEEVLPVLVGERTMPQENTEFVPQLTSAGQASPVFEGIAGFFRGPGNQPPDDRLPKLPPLRGCVSVVSAKPTASVLAVHPERRNQAGPLVALAVHQFGAGRSAAWTADTTWLWRQILLGQGRESPYARFWGQLVRYLAGAETKTRNAGTQVMVRLDRTYLEEGQALSIRSLVLDQREKAGELKLRATIVPDDPSKPIGQPLPLVAGEDNLFHPENPWKARPEGKYRIKVSAVDAANTELGSDEIPVTVAPHLKEMDRLDRDIATLQEIAKRSGGEYRDILRLPELLDEIERRQQSGLSAGPQITDVHLYNFPLLFLAFVGLLTGEWLLRRTWQLH